MKIKALIAECIGTFVLVFFACGVAAWTGCANSGAMVATALAFGLVIVAMAYSVGRISGCLGRAPSARARVRRRRCAGSLDTARAGDRLLAGDDCGGRGQRACLAGHGSRSCASRLDREKRG